MEVLRERFPDCDAELLQDVLSHSNGEIHTATDRLQELGVPRSAPAPAPNNNNNSNNGGLLGMLGRFLNPDSSKSQGPRAASPLTRMSQGMKLQSWLRSHNLAQKTDAEKVAHFISHPQDYAELRKFMGEIGLGALEPGQLEEYFHGSINAEGKPVAGAALPADKRRKGKPYPFAGMAFSPDEKRQFARDGFFVAKQMVDPAMCKAAKRAINYHLGKSTMSADIRLLTSCPALVASDVILNLFYQSPALALAQSLVSTIKPITHGQIALRYPGDFCDPLNDAQIAAGADFKPVQWWGEGWHIDGFDKSKHPGDVNTFIAVVGVALSDATEDFTGNLAVFPGGHKIAHEEMKQEGGVALLRSQPDNNAWRDRVRNRIRGTAQQVKTNVGDVVIFNGLLPHTITPNASPDVRYMVYFRLEHGSRQPISAEVVDMWAHWDGLQGVAV
eukprot:TRINITY_DN52049_c0_g1_i1.p1 TRINITY_DN52049_c0_g1~~TRINITY_DN52049_c0_g1_i1.p1  ORF type:complete len:444 (-),score=40.52 TRINITY_DN52049_c0_g1_i1:130-1461(-)